MHPVINTQHIKIEVRIFPSIFSFISHTLTVIAQQYIGLQKRLTKKIPCKNLWIVRLTTVCQAKDLLSEFDTLLFICHECIKPDRIVNFYRIADVLYEYIGDPFIAF